MCKYLNNFPHDIYLQIHVLKESEAMHTFDKKKMANERKTEKAIMKGKRQSQWFSFAKYTIFRYGLFKTRMVVTTPITDGCFWIAKTFFFSAKAAAGYERNDTITVDLEMTPVKNSPIRSKMHL